MKRTGSSLLTEPPIPPEEGVRLMAGDLERGHRFGKAVLHFVVYRAESTRARSEALLEARLREIGFRIERVRLPLPEEPDWPYWLHFHPPDGDTVFFVYDLRKAFPEMLQYLNYRREIFVEQRVQAVFWVLEEEAREIALKAPDFWAFRTQVLEFLEVPPPRERVEIARELAWWGWYGVPYAYESPEEIEERIVLRERLLAELREVEEAAAARAELLYSLGGLYWAKRDFEQALEYIRQALELARQTDNERLVTWAHNGLGNVYDELGRYEEAIAEYQRAIELDPKDAYPHNGLGNVYYELGRYDEALAEYERAIELDPKYAYPHNGLGSVYYELGRYDDAIAEYERAIELNPTDGGFYYNLGNANVSLERHEEAIQTYLKAIELKPDYLPAYLALGRTYRQLDRYEELARHSQRARELLAPDDHYNWACLEAICGNTEKALEHLKLALEKEPGLRGWAKRDPDLEWIRGDERFWEVVG
jgi:tetratricopeptide (TPR) repeat protein